MLVAGTGKDWTGLDWTGLDWTGLEPQIRVERASRIECTQTTLAKN